MNVSRLFNILSLLAGVHLIQYNVSADGLASAPVCTGVLQCLVCTAFTILTMHLCYVTEITVAK